MFKLDSRALRLFRILIAIIVIYDVWDRLGAFQVFYGEFGIFRGTGGLGEFPNYSLFNLSSASWFRYALFGSLLFSAGALLLGLYSRVAAAVTWFLMLNLQHADRLTTFSGDDVLRLLLFAAIFLPIGSPRQKDSPAVEVAAAALTGLMATIFLTAGLTKILDASWRAGQGVRPALLGFGTDVGHLLLDSPLLLALLGFVTIAIQIVAPLFLFTGRRSKIFSILLLIAFQVALAICLRLSFFPWITIAGLIALWPSSKRWQRPSVKEGLVCAFALLLPLMNAGKSAAVFKAIGLSQNWSMFTSVSEHVYWLSLTATQANGQRMDLANLEEFRSERTALEAELPARVRWFGLVNLLGDQTIVENLAEALCVSLRDLKGPATVTDVRIAVASSQLETLRNSEVPLQTQILKERRCGLPQASP